MADPASDTQDSRTIPASAMALISPSALLYAHLTQSPPMRPTNRAPTEARPVNLNTSSLTHANGSSLVRIGDTTVVCGVRAEILPVQEIANYRASSSQILDHTPSEGDYTTLRKHNLLVPNLDLSTGCSPLFPPNSPPSTTAQVLTQRIFTLLHSTHLISPSSLKIYHTQAHLDPDSPPPQPTLKAFWTLYIDLLALSHTSTSTTFDCAWLALLAALSDTLLPLASWDADINTVICSPDVSLARPLEFNGTPVPLSFGVFVPEKRIRKANTNANEEREQKWIIVDPDGFEESCCEETGTVTVAASRSGELSVVKIEKSGGTGISVSEMRQLVELAEKRYREFNQMLYAA